MADLHGILVRPMITEKSSAAWQDRGEYVFEVHPEATKDQIKAALKQFFGVNATKVRTMQMRRHEVRPGITGWAQVNGRNALTWEQKFKLDVWYVDNRSLWLDLKIIVRTIPAVLAGEGR